MKEAAHATGGSAEVETLDRVVYTEPCRPRQDEGA